ncbi:hypothetical protein [Barrientosiimonas endolithica]|uniref:Uncharacterized protein n=1 Tax=Barrientosiimonas endolithica TaxID=1535208 RepID=A0ABM8HDH8_9MICO|nr:hypothetical protein [Barrientosiimonas endolithica]BDZ59038.1 hypothetical protein GCM10025872_26950 [Barrientosiimonas endolithica]
MARDWVREGAAALEQVEVANGDDVTLPYAEFRSLHNVWDQHLDVIPRGALERAAAPVPYPILLGGNFAARRETLLQVGDSTPAWSTPTRTTTWPCGCSAMVTCCTARTPCCTPRDDARAPEEPLTAHCGRGAGTWS